MHASDNAFFEAYKNLDKLCSDIYSGQSGVSAYLSDMESRSDRGRLLVTAWDTDHKRLKHVRWVRNRIAHDTGSPKLSEPSDLSFVRDFSHRILSGKDPLALLRQAEEAKRSGKRTKQVQPDQADPPPIRRKSPGSALTPVLFGCILLALLLLAIVYKSVFP